MRCGSGDKINWIITGNARGAVTIPLKDIRLFLLFVKSKYYHGLSYQEFGMLRE